MLFLPCVLCFLRRPLLGFNCSLAAQATSALDLAAGMAKAREALEHDHADEAIALLQQIAAAQPAAKGVQHELGLAYYRTGKLLEARNAFANAIDQNSADRESVQMEGLVLYRMGQPAAAIPFLERVRQWMPGANADAQYVLGLCYLKAQRLDDARAAFANNSAKPRSRRSPI